MFGIAVLKLTWVAMALLSTTLTGARQAEPVGSALTALRTVAPHELSESKGLPTTRLPVSLPDGIDIGNGIRLRVAGASDGYVNLTDGVREYGSLLATTHLLVQALPHGSGRLLAVLDGPAAPDVLEFELTGYAGLSLRPVGNGSMAVISPSGEMLSVLQQPWARDAAGQPVATYYESYGNRLRQVVAHHGHTYPVVMDPSWWRVLGCVGAVTWLVGAGYVSATAIAAWGGPVMAAQLLIAAGGGDEWAKAVMGTGANILGVKEVRDNCF